MLATYAASIALLPTMVPAVIWDDWAYAKSVETLLDDGVLRINDYAAATLLFQMLWGGLFASLLDNTLGALRLSTTILVGFSAVTFYWLLRELAVERRRAALGVALYLFNPLSFVLTFTFQTDAPFVAMLVIALALYVRGLREPAALWFTLGGSVAASFASLIRHQGELIPAAVVLLLLGWSRFRISRALVVRVVAAAALPAMTAVGYVLWLQQQSVPVAQGAFMKFAVTAGLTGTSLVAARTLFVEIMYIGLFTLPLGIAALVPLVRRRVRVPAAAWLAMAGTVALLLGGWALAVAWGRARMPFGIAPWWSETGLGPDQDLVTPGRDALVGPGWLQLLTAVCAITALAYVLYTTRALSSTNEPRLERGSARHGAQVVLVVLLFQLVGVMLPSISFGGPLDRYLLPLVPLSVALLLWALRDVRFQSLIAVAATTALVAFSLIATRDFLRFNGTVWELGNEAVTQGVALTELDAGAGWSGYYTGHLSRAEPRHVDDVSPDDTRPWYRQLWGTSIDPRYVVAKERIGGYRVVQQSRTGTWLESYPKVLYLLERRTGSRS